MKRSDNFARCFAVGTCMLLLALVGGAGAQTYSVLTSFNDTNGSQVYETPTVDASGNVFGTASQGGNSDCGVVYELVNNGGGSYTNNTLYNFTCLDDGGRPESGLVLDSSGNLYGTASEYGANGAGVVFELVNDGGGTYGYSVLHAFTGTDGNFPEGDLVWHNGSLYGTTDEGGGRGCYYGCGTVYRLTKTGSSWTHTILHTFNELHDGNYPSGGVVLDSNGNIYGTTEEGGTFNAGTVFRLSPAAGFHGPGVTYEETILHSFDAAADGCYIESGLVMDSAGNLYGTADECGVEYDGTVFQLKRTGSKYEFNVLLQFDYTNGEYPYDETGHLAIDSSGNIYGTAERGGANGNGVVFRLAAGTFAYTDLHDFQASAFDGSEPDGGVSLDSHGNLYGTTYYGGTSDAGTVWQILNP